MIRTRLQGDTPFFPNMLNNGKVEVCLKEDVDKVIADLEESHKKEVEQLLIEIVELKKQVHDYAQGLYIIQAKAEKEARHNKYKRCLAMARLCLREYLHCNKYKITFWLKWRKRWFKIAEKLKEVK